jgi:hypothetical protein
MRLNVLISFGASSLFIQMARNSKCGIRKVAFLVLLAYLALLALRTVVSVGHLHQKTFSRTPETSLTSQPMTCTNKLNVTAFQRNEAQAMITKVREMKLTMVSPQRLENALFCVLDIIARGLEGDVVETGVWKGGVSMVMRKVILATGTENCHHSWLFDSYEGLPQASQLDIKMEEKEVAVLKSSTLVIIRVTYAAAYMLHNTG